MNNTNSGLIIYIHYSQNVKRRRHAANDKAHLQFSFSIRWTYANSEKKQYMEAYISDAIYKVFYSPTTNIQTSLN